MSNEREGGKEETKYYELNSSTEESSSGDEDTTWISWFCTREGNEFFCQVSEDFIADNFNLTGLHETFREIAKDSSQIIDSIYKDSFDLMSDVLEGSEPEEEYFKDASKKQILKGAEIIYGLIHQRFILTKAGLQKMAMKYENGDFGSCPRVCCSRTHVVPIGLTDKYGKHEVKVFCPKCCDIYTPTSRRQASIDGSFFGTTMPHLLFMSSPKFRAPSSEQMTVYVPRIYGFKIHSTSPSAPSVQKFLRSSPYQKSYQKEDQRAEEEQQQKEKEKQKDETKILAESKLKEKDEVEEKEKQNEQRKSDENYLNSIASRYVDYDPHKGFSKS